MSRGRAGPTEGRRLIWVGALLLLIGLLEGWNVCRQRRRGRRASEDRDPASKTLLALTWWTAGVVAILAARVLPAWGLPRYRQAGNVAGLVACVLMPLVGIVRRIRGEERELLARLPGYREYARGTWRLVPHVW